MLVTLLVFSMGSAGGGRDTTVQLLLAGLAINAIAGAVAGLLTYIADDQQLRSITFWQMGSLGGIGWSDLTMMASIMLPATLLLWLLAKPLDAILLGESVAMHMGVSVAQVRIAIIVLGALLVGTAVSMSGMVGFVGLMAPHMARMLLGASHRWLLPGSALIGALLVSFADILSRTLVAPAEIPIGLVTAAMGSPFFLYLLYRRRVL
jgi:iron complex transport system permease protein